MENVYRVTYANGEVGATCNKKSLAGKIGLSNQYLRRFLRRDRYYSSYYNEKIIVKIERAPVEGWDDVTSEFASLLPL